MGIAGNLALAVGGALLEGAVLILGLRTVRRVVKSRRQPPVRAIADIERTTPERRRVTAGRKEIAS